MSGPSTNKALWAALAALAVWWSGFALQLPIQLRLRPVDGGPAHAGPLGDPLMGDRARPLIRQQLAGRGEHRLPAARRPRIRRVTHRHIL